MSQDIKDMNLSFEPNKKEIEEFNKEKLNIYKGTFVVCLVYGLVAIGLLLAGAFTEWGREYIYNKMLPATATFVFGALFIVLYLGMSIYDLKPRPNRTKQDIDNGIICPDYWKLKRLNDVEKQKLVAQAAAMKGTKDFQIINNKDPRLEFKCELDAYIQPKNDMKTNNTIRYKDGYDKTTPSTQRIETDPQYIYVESSDAANSLYKPDTKLATEYAKLSGFYDSSTTVIQPKTDDSNLINKHPLKCSEVYPRILEDMDKNTPEQNKYRCEYAKACDIPWTNLGCKYQLPKK